MKRTKTCPKCDSTKVGYLAAQPVTNSAMPHQGRVVETDGSVSSRALGQGQAINTGFMRYGTVPELIGELEAYVCADCGYHETYVKEPQSVRWDELRGFHWLHEDPNEAGPYR